MKNRSKRKKGPAKDLYRLKFLQKYCDELLSCDPRVIKSADLVRFFQPREQDLQPEFNKNGYATVTSYNASYPAHFPKKQQQKHLFTLFLFFKKNYPNSDERDQTFSLIDVFFILLLFSKILLRDLVCKAKQDLVVRLVLQTMFSHLSFISDNVIS